MRNTKLIIMAFCLSVSMTMSADFPTSSSNSSDYVQYVDPYIGSGGHGHVFVGASVPYGMVQVGPSNIFKGWDWCSGYHYSDSILIGFSHTHLSGTGCNDLGDILLMPMNEVRTERGDQKDISNGYVSTYSHKNEVVRPYYYSVLLDKYQIRAELTATARVGFHRYTYSSGKPSYVLVDLHEGNGDDAYSCYARKVDDYTVAGYRYTHGWSPDRKVYFVLKSNVKIRKFTLYDGNAPTGRVQLRAKSVKGLLDFGQTGQVRLKVALSPVSIPNAMENMESELPGWDFESVEASARSSWNAQLSKIRIRALDDRERRIFYTSLYHTMIDPSLYCDVNGQYRGIDDMVYTDPSKSNYTTMSLWDTYRAWTPLMTLIQPELVPHLVNSMISIYRQQDKLPIWPLWNGETNCMPGYSSVPVIADAYLKDFAGFNASDAFEAMKATATNPAQSGVPYVMKDGFIPADKEGESVSKAMEYAVDDWGIAAVALRMGKKEDASVFGKRALFYKSYFDPSVGFARPKLSDGTWKGSYNPATAGVRDFTEGNGWQYTFFAPQDPYGLIGLFGGDKGFVKKLDRFFTCHDSMGPHAQSDITGLIGQYAHGNEPSHHVAYLYAYAGEQWKTAEKVRYVMDEFYTDRPDGIIGNEDCGQMSAWYVLSSMGLYQVNPCDGVFVFGSPALKEASVTVRGGKVFTVEAEGNSKANRYIQKVYLNGKPYTKSYITYGDIITGSTLKFVMGSKPNKSFGSSRDSRPVALNRIASN
nr:GH92 family glycosyl hydrolase [Prevotella sp.]